MGSHLYAYSEWWAEYVLVFLVEEPSRGQKQRCRLQQHRLRDLYPWHRVPTSCISHRLFLICCEGFGERNPRCKQGELSKIYIYVCVCTVAKPDKFAPKLDRKYAYIHVVTCIDQSGFARWGRERQVDKQETHTPGCIWICTQNLQCKNLLWRSMDRFFSV